MFPVHNSSSCKAAHASPRAFTCLTSIYTWSSSMFFCLQNWNAYVFIRFILPSQLFFQPAPLLSTIKVFTSPLLLLFISCCPRDRSSSPVASILVPPRIEQLLAPEQAHQWCIPFTVTGNPKPKLLWYHNKVLLQEQDFIRTMIHESTENEDHGCLQLANPTHIHNGEYKLVARNEYGRDEKTVTAQFLYPPNITGQFASCFQIRIFLEHGFKCDKFNYCTFKLQKCNCFSCTSFIVWLC